MRGLGVHTAGTFDLKYNGGVDSLCESTQVVNFEHLRCKTRAGVLLAQELTFVWTDESSVATSYSCVPDGTLCTYSTHPTNPTPTVISSSYMASPDNKI